jgi:hypothetical protein
MCVSFYTLVVSEVVFRAPSHMYWLGESQGIEERPILLNVAQSPISDGFPEYQSRLNALEIPSQEKPPCPKDCRLVRIGANPSAKLIYRIQKLF